MSLSSVQALVHRLCVVFSCDSCAVNALLRSWRATWSRPRSSRPLGIWTRSHATWRRPRHWTASYRRPQTRQGHSLPPPSCSRWVFHSVIWTLLECKSLLYILYNIYLHWICCVQCWDIHGKKPLSFCRLTPSTQRRKHLAGRQQLTLNGCRPSTLSNPTTTYTSSRWTSTTNTSQSVCVVSLHNYNCCVTQGHVSLTTCATQHIQTTSLSLLLRG